MAINPCFMPLQKSVKVMAIIDILWSVVEIIRAGWDIAYIVRAIAVINEGFGNAGLTVVNNEGSGNADLFDQFDVKDLHVTNTQVTPTSGLAYIVIVPFAAVIIIAIVKILLSIRLLGAAKNREMRFCKIWLIIAIIFAILALVIFIFFGGDSLKDVAMLSTGLLFQLYMIWVVYAFFQELKVESSTDGVGPRKENGVVYNTQII